MEQSLIIAGLLLKYGPQLAMEVQRIFTLAEPTQADWQKVWTLAQTPFDQIVPKKP